MSILVYLCGILKSVIYGSSVFFTGKLTETVDILDILALRFLMSFVVFWLLKVTGVVKIRVGAADFIKKERRMPGMGVLLLAALFEPVLYMFFETFGISMTTGITTGVILALSPITSCIVETLILHEKSSWLQRFFLGVGIVGVMYIAVKTSTTDGEDSVLGIIMLMLAVLSGSLFCAFSRKSSQNFNAMEVTYISAMLGTMIFNGINVVRHIYLGDMIHYFMPYFNPDNLIGFAFLSILSTIAATAMNNYALGKIKPSVMAAFGGISTIVTVVIGAVFFHEKIYYFHIIGFVLILIRMVGVTYLEIKKENMI